MKILKTAAIVVAAVTLAVVTAGVASGGSAAFIFSALAANTIGAVGISAGAATAILGGVVALGAVSALSAIAPQPSAGGSQTKWKADPYAGVPYVMGRTGTSGNIVGKRGSGGHNTYEHFVTVLSGGGPIHAIEASFANRTTVLFDSSGTASGTFNNLIWQKSQLGNCPESNALVPARGPFPGWDATSKLSGMAATLVTMEYDAKGKHQLTTEPQMFWIVQGVYVYDPRLDSTFPGGSGTCRAFDETTYVYSENPHLHALTWAMGRYQNGKRVLGIGAKISEIDVASFVEGANLDDARGWKVGGQVVTRPDAPWTSLKAILQAGGATPSLVGGMIICINRYPRVSLATITGADIVGDCSFAGTQPRRSRINGIIPMYRSEAHDWEMVTAAGVIIADYVALDGDERTKEVQYGLVQNVNQATQLATYDICDTREAGPGTVPLGPWWLNYRIGDCVTFNPEAGFLIKCLITGRDLDAQTGTVTYTIVSETDGKHALALGASGVAPPTASIVYDTSVGAPDPSAWSLIGTSATSPQGAVPVLEISGAVEDPSADAILFQYRSVPILLAESGAPLLSEAGAPLLAEGDSSVWKAAGLEPATTTIKDIGGVAPGQAYQVGISYRIRGMIGDPLILGPVVAGSLGVPRGAYRITTQSVGQPFTTNSNSITISAFQGILDDGRTINFPAGSVTGLSASSGYGLFYKLADGSYRATAAPSAAEMASSAYVFVSWAITSDASGAYPPMGGGGSAGSGGSGSRPVNSSA